MFRCVLACREVSWGHAWSIVAHGILLVLCAIALIDAPIAWVPRSAHLFLLPLAAGVASTFEARDRYGSLLFPLACLGMFSAFAIGALDPFAPRVSPPLEVRAWGAGLNAAFSLRRWLLPGTAMFHGRGRQGEQV